MKILLLSRYGKLGASSRLRLLQYLPHFESKGWQIDVAPLFSDNYLRSFYSGKFRGVQVIAGYCRRLIPFIIAGRYDLIWIEKEVFPFLPAFAERLLDKVGVPYVVDYDDALFHYYDQHRLPLVRRLLGKKIDVVMRHAKLVVAGNDYLAQRALSAGAKWVEIIPTVVDLDRYSVSLKPESETLIVGWIGTPSTSRYLIPLYSVFASLQEDFNVQFVAVGASVTQLENTPIVALPWAEETEVQSIQNFDIGVMPLVDTPWELGKCGYKLIQYMACGKPVVASSVGVNKTIVKENTNGLLAQTLDDWHIALSSLLADDKIRKRMGLNARECVENWYSLQVQASRLEFMMVEAGS